MVDEMFSTNSDVISLFSKTVNPNILNCTIELKSILHSIKVLNVLFTSLSVKTFSYPEFKVKE